MRFHGLVYINEDKDALKERKMRVQFAEQCMLVEPLTNENIYNTLSHLALISQLGINLHRYENLRVYPNSQRLNSDTYLYAKQKLEEARSL